MDDRANYAGTECRGTSVRVQHELVWGQCRARRQWGDTAQVDTERVGCEKGKEMRDENSYGEERGGREGEKEHSREVGRSFF
jgi:hypothetical protein